MVVSTRIELVSGASETLILSIVLRDHTYKEIMLESVSLPTLLILNIYNKY